VHATLIAGSTAHLQSRFSPAGLIGLARQTAASVLFGVPATYQALLDTARERGALAEGAYAEQALASGSPVAGPWLGRLRLAVCGSAPLRPGLARELPALLGQLPLVRYGTTESGLDVSNPLGRARADTVGLPLPGVECRVWPIQPVTAPPGGGPVPGTGGEIQLRGPQVFGGYWGDPAATATAFTADGWFRTGDIGAVDEATGHLVIHGRIKELIISGGLNVYPREVEAALESHPAVAEAAVAGVPHPRWGEQVTAWVVLRPGATADAAALIAHARTQLAAYKCPKQVFQVTALPRTALGKLNRRALRPPGHRGQHHGGGAG
jgi:malonyl-CoA/methylmalonyl-CoA synthetase